MATGSKAAPQGLDVSKPGVAWAATRRLALDLLRDEPDLPAAELSAALLDQTTVTRRPHEIAQLVGCICADLPELRALAETEG